MTQYKKAVHLLMQSVLRRWPLPYVEGGDKDNRGTALIIGGSREISGAIVLSGIASLRAGAGKLQMATCASIAHILASTVLEARVIGLDEVDGDIAPSAAKTIAKQSEGAAAVLVGPGMLAIETVQELMSHLLPQLSPETNTTLVLDAAALSAVTSNPTCLHHLSGKAIVTPHAGEMAIMRGAEKEAIQHDPLTHARRAAEEWQAIVVLKGAETYIAAPNGEAYHFKGGTVGLATSGSGDALAGLITGLAARGASPLQAAVWGVYLHGEAGQQLAKRMGHMGFLARELLAEVPLIMHKLQRPASAT